MKYSITFNITQVGTHMITPELAEKPQIKAKMDTLMRDITKRMQKHFEKFKVLAEVSYE